jgi:hypothetical protein
VNKISLLALLVLTALLASACHDSSQTPSAVSVTAFTHVNVVPLTAEIVLADQTVLVQDARIVAIGASDQIPIPREAQVIDGRGAYLMPGLADMHTHSQNDWVNSDNWPVSPLTLFVANGVTTIRDCGHVGDISLPLFWREEIADGRLVGPTIFTAGNVMHGDARGPIYPGVIQDEIDSGFDFIKIMAAYSEDFELVMSEAKAADAYTVGHIPYQVGLAGVLSAGMDEIAHVEEFFFDLLAVDHSLRLTDEQWFAAILENGVQLYQTTPDPLSRDGIVKTHGEAISAAVEQLRSTDTIVATTVALGDIVDQKVYAPEAYLARPESTYLSQDCRDRIRAGQDRHQRQIEKIEDAGLDYLLPTKEIIDQLFLEELIKVGIPLLLAPDSGGREMCVVPGFSTHDELRVLTEHGYSPYQAIRTGTVNAAMVVNRMGGNADFGTIQVGMRADLVLLGGNPLEYVDHTREIRGVMVRGTWYSRAALDQLLDQISTPEASIPPGCPAHSQLRRPSPCTPGVTGPQRRAVSQQRPA